MNYSPDQLVTQDNWSDLSQFIVPPDIDRDDVFQVDLPYSGGTYHLSGGRSASGPDRSSALLALRTGYARHGLFEYSKV